MFPPLFFQEHNTRFSVETELLLLSLISWMIQGSFLLGLHVYPLIALQYHSPRGWNSLGSLSRDFLSWTLPSLPHSKITASSSAPPENSHPSPK